jgi:hypothetical protein
VSLVRKIKQRVDVYAVKNYQRRKILGKTDIQTSDGAKAVLVGAIGESRIGGDGQFCFAAQILARRGVKRLAGRGSDTV